MDKRMKLSESALEQVVGGADTDRDKKNDTSWGETKRKCPNRNCRSHDINYPGYDGGQATFKVYGGGRAFCSVCNQEIEI